MRLPRFSLLFVLLPLALPVVGAPCFELAAQPAAGAPSKRKVLVYTEGARSNDVSDQIKASLPETGDVIASDEFKKSLAKQGQKLPLGLTITLESKRGPMIAKIGKAVAEAGAEAAIVGFVRPKRPFGNEVVVLVIEAGKDSPSIDKVVALGGDKTKADLSGALSPLTSSWGSASSGGGDAAGTGGGGEGGDKPPEDKKPDVGPAEDDAEWVRPKNVYGHEIFQINASFDVGGRFFGYNDGVTSNLRDYSVFGAPGISGRVELFPFAPLGIIVLRDIGLTGEVRAALGLSSETSDGTAVSTQWLRFGGGLRYRIPIGDKEKPFVLGVRGGFVQDGFVLDATGALAAEAPSVKYNFIRGGLDGRFPIGPVAITAFGGYLGAIDSGDVHARFTDASVGGIDVGGGLTVPIVYGLEARLQAEYVRWFYAFAPEVGDAFVAGGALDEYIHLEIGPQYVF